MPKAKKRLSKNAKAALKTLTESKLLAVTKAAEAGAGDEFRSSVVTPRTNTKAMKPRPDKKRG
ncbi:MAG TPA: hypothetical protein PKD26_10870 [Pyrinomonadaceae bacterium]|nr:hypothetical protein [Pyrinomonadaceae bacterium]